MSAIFFGVQLAIHAPPGDPLRRRLVEAVRAGAAEQSLSEKRAYHARLANLLLEVSARWRFGTWDYVAGGAGERTFDEWAAGLELSAAENPGDVYDDEHVVVTLVFLLDEGSPAEEIAGARCDVHESWFHKRETYARLVETVKLLPFAHVRADGAYVVPGEGGPGLSADELLGEGWDYLQRVVD
jgi:hypothetical protein